MNRSMLLLCLLGAMACDPLAKNAGVVETSDTDGTPDESSGDATVGSSADATTGDSVGSADTGDPGGPEGINSLLIDAGVVTHLVSSDAGVVAVIQAGEPPYDLTVTEYDHDFDEQWTVSLGTGAVTDIAPLPAGGFVVGGIAAPTTAAAWRLSCCGAIEDAEQYPTPTMDPAAITVAQPLAGGVLLVRDRGDVLVDFISADLDLVAVSIDPAPEMTVVAGTTTASGTVALTASEGGPADLVYELGPDGAGDGVSPGEELMLAGRGEALAMLTFSNPSGVNARDYEGGMVVPITVPLLAAGPDRRLHADHRERYAIAHAFEVGDGVTTELVEAYDDGAIARQTMLPPTLHPFMAPAAVAIADDQSIWVSTAETPTGVELLPDMVGTLHRIAAL